MTQTDRFLQFLQMRAEREIREMDVLVRIENDGLVITSRYPHRTFCALLGAGQGIQGSLLEYKIDRFLSRIPSVRSKIVVAGVQDDGAVNF
jgi:hypothetical protein